MSTPPRTAPVEFGYNCALVVGGRVVEVLVAPYLAEWRAIAWFTGDEPASGCFLEGYGRDDAEALLDVERLIETSRGRERLLELCLMA
jgi:hypothetical protein